MKITTTIILVLLLAITGVVFIYQANQPPARPNGSASQTADAGPGDPVFEDQPIEPDQVRTLSIKRNGKTVKLSREGGQWEQTQPVRFPLKQGSISQLIKAAVNLRYVNRFTPGQGNHPTLSELNLDPPATTFTFQTDTGKHTLVLSDKTVGGTGHALIDDRDQAYVVTDTLQNRLAGASANDWRQTSIQAPPATQADRLTIDKPDGKVSLFKVDGDWFLTKDKSQRASNDAVTGLVGAVNSVRINKFVSDNPKNLSIYGLNAPRITTTLYTPPIKKANNPQTHTLRIGGPADLSEDAYYATWTQAPAPSKSTESSESSNSPGHDGTPVVFTVDAGKVKPFKVTAADLRDSNMAAISNDEVNGLRIERGSKPTIHLQREGMRFVFAKSGPEYEADATATDDLLKSILNAQARSYHPDFSPKAEPKATLTLSRRGGGSEVIRVYPGKGDNKSSEPTYITLRDGETVGYEVPAGDLKSLFDPLLALRDRTLLTPGPDAITRVVVKRPDGTYTFTPSDQKGTADDQFAWKMNGTTDFEQPALTDLRNALKPLRAKRWLADSAKLKPTEQWLTLTVDLADRKPLALRIDPETGQATMQGVDQPLVLPSEFVDKVRAEFRDRDLLSLNVKQIQSVEIAQPGDDGKPITVRRDSEGGYHLAGEGEINEPQAAGIFNTLAGLRAKRYHGGESLKVNADQPTYRLTLTTNAGQTHTLKLYPAKATSLQTPVGRLDTTDRYFSLEPSDYRKLTAEPVIQQK